jgi:hypothetical protein
MMNRPGVIALTAVLAMGLATSSWAAGGGGAGGGAAGGAAGGGTGAAGSSSGRPAWVQGELLTERAALEWATR